MGGKGGGGAQPSYNYYGTIVGLIGIGPYERLDAFIIDGKAAWEGSITRDHLHPENTYIDLTGSIDASNFMPGGYLRFYWGTEAQTADTYLASLGHPGYNGYAYWVARHILFGLERTTPRDMGVVATRLPIVDTRMVAAGDNVLSDGQANPIATIAEVLTAPYGLAIPLSRIDLASWLATAHAVAAKPDLAFCSPLIDSFEAAVNMLSDLADMCDAGVRWSAAGKLECILKNWGTTPDGTITLDARHFIDGTRIETEGMNMDDVPTGIDVGFTDRDKEFKDSSEPVDNLWAQQLRAENDRQQLTRAHVTRRSQARLIGVETIRQTDQPRTPVTGQFLRAAAVNGAGDPLLPGDKVFIDVDPIPGGDGLAQSCLIIERSEGRVGAVTLKMLADTLAASSPYSPAWVTPEPQEATATPIAHADVIPLPPDFEAGIAVAILATRPSPDLVGFRIFFDSDDADGSFPELGHQIGFAARCTLVAGVADDAGTFRLQLVDGADSPDAELAGRTPDNDLAARADPLLGILFNRTFATGRGQKRN